MNYQKHYRLLIERAACRALSGYRERHHVVPRCMGGTDAPSNVVALTAEEHYVAHQLLVKMHPGVGPLVTVTMLMAKKCSGNKAYGWLRRKNAAALSAMPARSAKITASLMGNTRAHALLGRKRPPRAKEWAAKVAAQLRSLPKRKAGEWAPTAETRARMSAAMKRRNLDQRGENNYCAKLSRGDVRSIRHLYFAERRKQREIAAHFRVSVPTVSMIVNRQRWNY